MTSQKHDNNRDAMSQSLNKFLINLMFSTQVSTVIKQGIIA